MDPAGIIIRLAPLLAASSLGAVELVIRELDVGARYLIQGFDYTLDDPAGAKSGTDAFDTGFGFVVGGRYGFTDAGDRSGFYVGGDLAWAVRSNDEATLTTYGIEAIGGWAYAFTDAWVLRLEACGLYDLGTFTVDGGGKFDAVSGSGSSYGFGLDTGISFAVTERALLKLDLGFEYARGTYDLGDVTAEVTASGLRIALGFVWCISTAPSPLE